MIVWVGLRVGLTLLSDAFDFDFDLAVAVSVDLWLMLYDGTDSSPSL